ncbi:MAG: formylglycine-generating enzyme family protein [Planctomycetota bacterium]|nr:formylglycine-generating enzyme family protein [Planctomycetota bacterium]
MDKDLNKWRRITLRDPSDLAAHSQHAQAYLRLHGDVFNDFKLWIELDAVIALSLARVLEQRLGLGYDFVRIDSHQSASGTFYRAIFKHTKSKVELGFLPAGFSEYRPGSPKHSHPVFIGTAPVNFDQWKAITKRQRHDQFRSDEKARGPDGFVACASWNLIQTWLEKAGAGLRLPCEAEWHYNESVSNHFQIPMIDEVQAQWIASLESASFLQIPAPIWECLEDSAERNDPVIHTSSGTLRIGVNHSKLQVNLQTESTDIAPARTRPCDPKFERHDVGFRVAVSLSRQRWDEMLRVAHVESLRDQPLFEIKQWQELATPQESIARAVVEELGRDFLFTEIKDYECGSRWRIATLLHEPTKIEFQLIPGGEFQFGVSDLSAERDFCHSLDPKIGENVLQRQFAAKTIRVAPFLMAKTPLTQEQWFRGLLMPPEVDNLNRKDRRKWQGLNLPVVGLSGQRIDFWLRKLAHCKLRLPTEMEWEYACRGTANLASPSTRYFWGNELSDDYCWHKGNSEHRIHDVTEHKDKTNAFGLVDMLGNVFERCSDRMNNNSVSWQDFSTQQDQVSRGGSWAHDGIGCRIAHRRPESRITRHNHVGVRLAISLPSSLSEIVDQYAQAQVNSRYHMNDLPF